MLKDASNSPPTLQAEILELLLNIMEGAVRECPPAKLLTETQAHLSQNVLLTYKGAINKYKASLSLSFAEDFYIN